MEEPTGQVTIEGAENDQQAGDVDTAASTNNAPPDDAPPNAKGEKEKNTPRHQPPVAGRSLEELNRVLFGEDDTPTGPRGATKRPASAMTTSLKKIPKNIPLQRSTNTSTPNDPRLTSKKYGQVKTSTAPSMTPTFPPKEWPKAPTAAHPFGLSRQAEEWTANFPLDPADNTAAFSPIQVEEGEIEGN